MQHTEESGEVLNTEKSDPSAKPEIINRDEKNRTIPTCRRRLKRGRGQKIRSAAQISSLPTTKRIGRNEKDGTQSRPAGRRDDSASLTSKRVRVNRSNAPPRKSEGEMVAPDPRLSAQITGTKPIGSRTARVKREKTASLLDGPERGGAKREERKTGRRLGEETKNGSPPGTDPQHKRKRITRRREKKVPAFYHPKFRDRQEKRGQEGETQSATRVYLSLYSRRELQKRGWAEKKKKGFFLGRQRP